MNQSAIAEICTDWRNPDRRPLFKDALIDEDGRCCAQGEVLRRSGVTDGQLRAMAQVDADREVARLLGISVAHSCLLRIINDRQDGCPEDALEHPERVLGDQAQRILAFWRRLDGLTATQWTSLRVTTGSHAADACDAVRDDARDAAWDAAWDLVKDDALYAAQSAAEAAAWAAGGVSVADAADAAAAATNEIQNAEFMRSRGQPFVFLLMFGISDPAELDD